MGDDGKPMADVRGAESELTDRWRGELKRIDEEMIIWSRTYRLTYGSNVTGNGKLKDEDVADEDPYDNDEDASDEWAEREDSEVQLG